MKNDCRFINENIIFRNIKKLDTESLWSMMNQLDHETKFMLYEPGERPKNLVRLQGAINNSVDGDDLCFLALDGEEIIGYITAQIGSVRRSRHEVNMQIIL